MKRVRNYLRALRWWWCDRPRWSDPRVTQVELEVTPEIEAALKQMGRSLTEVGQALTKAKPKGK